MVDAAGWVRIGGRLVRAPIEAVAPGTGLGEVGEALFTIGLPAVIGLKYSEYLQHDTIDVPELPQPITSVVIRNPPEKRFKRGQVVTTAPGSVAIMKAAESKRIASLDYTRLFLQAPLWAFSTGWDGLYKHTQLLMSNSTFEYDDWKFSRIANAMMLPELIALRVISVGGTTAARRSYYIGPTLRSNVAPDTRLVEIRSSAPEVDGTLETAIRNSGFIGPLSAPSTESTGATVSGAQTVFDLRDTTGKGVIWPFAYITVYRDQESNSGPARYELLYKYVPVSLDLWGRLLDIATDIKDFIEVTTASLLNSAGSVGQAGPYIIRGYTYTNAASIWWRFLFGTRSTGTASVVGT